MKAFLNGKAFSFTLAGYFAPMLKFSVVYENTSRG
jgi:hypothetical protein